MNKKQFIKSLEQIIKKSSEDQYDLVTEAIDEIENDYVRGYFNCYIGIANDNGNTDDIAEDILHIAKTYSFNWE